MKRIYCVQGSLYPGYKYYSMITNKADTPSFSMFHVGRGAKSLTTGN
ncbi:MAG: hypothetical protein WCK85_11050 [Chlorobium sp.]